MKTNQIPNGKLPSRSHTALSLENQSNSQSSNHILLSYFFEFKKTSQIPIDQLQASSPNPYI